jgi:hypothetical protein
MDPGRVISMSIAIADTFRRTMGISFHLPFLYRAPLKVSGALRALHPVGQAGGEAHCSIFGAPQSRTPAVR